MKPIHYILLVDITIVIVMIRFIFGSYGVFVKSLADHFFPDDLLPNPLDKFAEENDSNYKMNILYALLIFLAGLTFFGWYYFSK